MFYINDVDNSLGLMHEFFCFFVFLNSVGDTIPFNSVGKMSHIFGSKLDIVSEPCMTVLILLPWTILLSWCYYHDISIKRYHYHDFLFISEHQKCCKYNLIFCFGKFCLKKTLAYSETEQHWIVWNKISKFSYHCCHSKSIRWIK